VRKSRFSEESIIAVLESEAEVETGELCRQHGIALGVSSSVEGKFCGLELSEANRLRQLEGENRQLKYIVAEPGRAEGGVAKKW
jgi:putative transposase